MTETHEGFQETFLKSLKEGSPEAQKQKAERREFVTYLMAARTNHECWLTIMRFGLVSLSNDLPLITELILLEAEQIRGEKSLHRAFTEIMEELKLCFYPLGQY